MKNLFIGFLVCVFLVQSAIASPLVFKATKEVTSSDSVILATLDTLKFKQIRIAVKFVRAENSELDMELKSITSKLETGNISRLEYETKKRIIDERISKKSVAVFGLEDNQEFYLGGGLESFIIDSPPSKIAVKVSGAGKYMLYIWGS